MIPIKQIAFCNRPLTRHIRSAVPRWRIAVTVGCSHNPNVLINRTKLTGIDLGLDSLIGVEIKEALERDYDIVLSMKDIRTLTLNKLQNLAESGGQGATALQPTELDTKKEMERDAEQNTAKTVAIINELIKETYKC
ncbi:hypothetical protein GCK32_012520 [Trichostrongylus colubriformis]|uniref:Carrier domain-containing protein n=1 Tax=Trichostrongylus colubriformis TaxID=6319 RepID=A0AAN8FPL3_TRICO